MASNLEEVYMEDDECSCPVCQEEYDFHDYDDPDPWYEEPDIEDIDY